MIHSLTLDVVQKYSSRLEMRFKPEIKLPFEYRFSLIREGDHIVLLWDTGGGGMWFSFKSRSLPADGWDQWLALVNANHDVSDRDAAAMRMFLESEPGVMAQLRGAGDGQSCPELKAKCESYFETVRLHELAKKAGVTNDDMRIVLHEYGFADRHISNDGCLCRIDTPAILAIFKQSRKRLTSLGVLN